MRARLGPIALAVALGAAAACGGAQAPGAGKSLTYTEDARKAYEEALVAFYEHDWEEAVSLFKEVRRKYAYSRYARLAQLRIADAQAEQEKLTDAVASYRTFVSEHRLDDEVPYARFRICKALFDQIGDTVLLPPQEERDQTTAQELYKELRSFLSDHPRGRWRREAQWMFAVTAGRLVRHELYVARYYLQKEYFDPAVARIQYALRNYEGSGLEAEAEVLLGETYLKMHRTKEARTAFARVVEARPESAFSVTARAFLDEMDRAARAGR